MASKPVNALAAIVLALMPMPAMLVIDRANRGCGDGLCGFLPGVLVLAVLALATVLFLVLSARRGERPAELRLVPLILWPLSLVPMVV